MINRKLITVVLTGALALTIGIFSVGMVSAQDTTPTPETPAEGELNGPRLRGVRDGHVNGYLQEDLAAALGIDVETLQSAQQAASAEALQQAVSQGLITQEQADALAERGTGKFPWGGKGWLRASAIDYDALLADALNISVEQLQDAHDTAFEVRLDRAVADGQMTEEQAELVRGQRALAGSDSFRSSMRSAYESAVQQAVSERVITQEQAG